MLVNAKRYAVLSAECRRAEIPSPNVVPENSLLGAVGKKRVSADQAIIGYHERLASR
jgi:hypothetical protein